MKLRWRLPKGCKGKDLELLLKSFSDADWAGDPSTRRSTTGQAHFLNGLFCGWSSKIQIPLTLSSTESETVALSATGRAARGMENLLREVLQFLTFVIRVELVGDNHASLFIAEGEAGLRKVRHLELADLYCRVLAARDRWSVSTIGTAFNGADLGTKVLGAPELRRLRELVGIVT